jgi:hypothetical protein
MNLLVALLVIANLPSAQLERRHRLPEDLTELRLAPLPCLSHRQRYVP